MWLKALMTHSRYGQMSGRIDLVAVQSACLPEVGNRAPYARRSVRARRVHQFLAALKRASFTRPAPPQLRGNGRVETGTPCERVPIGFPWGHSRSGAGGDEAIDLVPQQAVPDGRRFRPDRLSNDGTGAAIHLSGHVAPSSIRVQGRDFRSQPRALAAWHHRRPPS